MDRNDARPASIASGWGVSRRTGAGRDRLPMSGDLQAQLAGAGAEDEFPQARRLGLPAELADASALHGIDPSSNRSRLLRGRCDQDLVGKGLDQPQTEKGRRVALGGYDNATYNDQ